MPFSLYMTKTDFEKFVSFLEKAEKEDFFGDISFKFRDGKIVMLTKNSTLKPEDI